MSVVKADWEEAQVKQSKLDDKDDEDWFTVEESFKKITSKQISFVVELYSDEQYGWR